MIERHGRTHPYPGACLVARLGQCFDEALTMEEFYIERKRANSAPAIFLLTPSQRFLLRSGLV
jgi:hypothetical protein